jgi:hypothetical protein
MNRSIRVDYYDISSSDARLEARWPGDWALPGRAWSLPVMMRDKKDIIG